MYFPVQCTGYREVDLTHTWTFFLSMYYRYFNCLITVKHVGRTTGDSSGNLRYRYEHIQMEQQQEVLALCLRSQLWLKGYSRRLETVVQTWAVFVKAVQLKVSVAESVLSTKKAVFVSNVCILLNKRDLHHGNMNTY